VGGADRVLAVGLAVDATLHPGAPRLPHLGHLTLPPAAAAAAERLTSAIEVTTKRSGVNRKAVPCREKSMGLTGRYLNLGLTETIGRLHAVR
jgi:hypothetical protein